MLSVRLTCGRRRSLHISEIMTILIHFHQSSYYTSKAYYLEHAVTHLRHEFLGLVDYNSIYYFYLCSDYANIDLTSYFSFKIISHV